MMMITDDQQHNDSGDDKNYNDADNNDSNDD